MKLNNIQKIVCACSVTAIGFQAQADTTLLDSYSSQNGNAFSLTSGEEIGNEVSLSDSAAYYNLTGFNFEYYSPDSTLSPSVGVDVRFYYNDGPTVNGFATPGTEFFDSGWFYDISNGSIPGAGYHTVVYDGTDFYGGSTINMPDGFIMPSDFTYTVSFTGLDSENEVDLPLANNVNGQPITTYGDYWQYDGTSWSLLQNGQPANLTSQFVAAAVPEPSTYLLGAIGGALFLGMSKFRKKSSV